MKYALRDRNEMKDLGTEWVRQIPTSWTLEPLKFVMRASDERVKDFPDLDLALSVSGYRGVEPRNVKTNDGQSVSEDNSNYRIVRKGQLVVNTMWLNFKGLGVSNFNGYVSPAYQSYFLTEKIQRHFAHYLLRSDEYVQKYASLLYGVRPNSLQVKRHDFDRLDVLLPSIDEQKHIADFLDEKTAVIDSIVTRKKKQIELLKEKRAALITQAVTKGLDPNVKKKDSGVEWIGEIPEKWRAQKLKFLATVQASNIDKKEYEDEECVLLCNYTDVYNNEKVSSEKEFMRATASKDQIAKLLLKSGDVLATKDSETADDIFVPAIVESSLDNLVCGYHLYHIRTNSDELNPHFLFRYLQGHLMRAYVENHANGVTRFGISQYPVLSLPVALPGLIEQKIIADFLDEKTAVIDKAISKIQSSINLIQEYCSALISHAVTGKIQIT